MASINVAAGTDRPSLVVVDPPHGGSLRQLFSRLADKATLGLARSRERAELGALRDSAELGRSTGARC